MYIYIHIYINKLTSKKNIHNGGGLNLTIIARAKMTVLKSRKQLLCSSTDELYHFSHYI